MCNSKIRNEGNMQKKIIIRIIQVAVAILYICVIFRMTLWNRSVHHDHIFYGLFWELRGHMWGDIIKNIALFVPLGLIIGGRKGVVIGFILSCGIEATQYFARLGYCEMDDVLNNTIGALIGAVIHQLLYKVEADIIERNDMAYKLKKVSVYDIPQLTKVAAILNACGKDMARKYNLHHWDNPYIKSFAIVCLCVLKNEVFLLYSDNSPVATFQIKVKNETLHFEKLGTLPSAAGQGIGSLCMKKIETIAQKRGCNKVVMEVYEPSQHAITFYENKGYKSVGMVDTLKYREIKMEKNI